MRSGVSASKKKKKKTKKQNFDYNQESEYASNVNTQQSLMSKRNKNPTAITFEEEEVAPEAVQIDIRKADVQVVEREGLNMQEKSKQALTRMQVKLEQAQEIGNEGLIELQKQNETIMKIDEKLNKIEATSQRAMGYVRYFGKTMMTDKFMLCMILFILITILTLIIVAIIKSKQTTAPPTQFLPQTNSTNST